MRQLLRQQLTDKSNSLARATQHVGRLHPRRRLEDWLQRLDDLQTSLTRCVRQGARRQRVVWQNWFERLSRVRPGVLLRQRRELLRQEEQRLHGQMRHRLKSWRDRVLALEAQLRLLGPEQVLARGYSITRDATTGELIRKAKDVQPGQRLRTRLKIGEVRSIAEPDET